MKESVVNNKMVQTSGSQEYVSFVVGDEEFGVPITRVQEIIRYERLTHIPQSAEYIRGVLNLRGRVMPVIDLRLFFGLEAAEIDSHTRIMVVEMNHQCIGITVDAVKEVLDIPPSKIDPAPDVGSANAMHFISGMGKLDERLLILLDLDRVVGQKEQRELMGILQTTSEPVAV